MAYGLRQQIYEKDNGQYAVVNARTLSNDTYSNFNTALDAAFDALTGSRTWPEVIELYGNFETDTITIAEDFFVLNMYGARLSLNDGVNDHMFSIAGDHWTVIGGYLWGNRANNTTTNKAVIHVGGPSMDWRIREVEIVNANEHGIWMDEPTTNAWIEYGTILDCKIHDCGKSGVVFNSWVQKVKVVGGDIHLNYWNGVAAQASGICSVIGVVLSNNSGHGIFNAGYDYGVYSNNHIMNNGLYGVQLDSGAEYNLIHGNIFITNGSGQINDQSGGGTNVDADNIKQ